MSGHRSAIGAAALLCAGGVVIAAELVAPARTPSTWTELPALVEAAPLPPASVVAARAAVGDPAQGVFLLWQDLAPSATALAEPLPAALEAALKSKEFSVTRAEGGRLEFRYRDRRGSVAVTTGPQGHARVLTCFYNERAPEASERQCAAIVASQPSP